MDRQSCGKGIFQAFFIPLWNNGIMEWVTSLADIEEG